MRVYSSLLGAAVVLVACVNASSTRSDSTIVTSTPPKHDVPLQRKLRGSDETDEEERDGIKGVINSFHSMVPDHEVDKIVSEWMANDKSVEDAFVSLDRSQHILQLNAWVRFAAAKKFTAFSDTMIGEVLEVCGPSGLGKMLEALGTLEGAEILIPRLRTKLIESWKTEGTSMIEALGYLRLDKPTDPPLRKRLLETWVMYGKTKGDPNSVMVEAINGCGLVMRLVVLEGLREIEGTESVVESALSKLMDFFEERKVSADSVFKLLKLDQPGDTNIRTLPFDAWVKYAAKKPASLSNDLIGEVLEHYGPSDFVTMIKAFGTAKDAEGVVFTLETKLTESWKTESTPLNKALSQLGLDKPTTPLLRNRLLKRWFNYGKTKDNSDSAMLEAIEGCNDEFRYATFEGLKNIWGASRVVKKVKISLKTSVEEKTLDVNVVFKAAELKPSDKMLLDDKKALDDKKLIKFNFAEWVKYAAASPTVLSEDTIRKVIDFHGDERFLKLFGAYLKAGRRKDADKMRRVFDKMEPPK